MGVAFWIVLFPILTCDTERSYSLVLWMLQGVAWTDIFAGEYFPALSFFKEATVSL